jgi:hypothetical protein
VITAVPNATPIIWGCVTGVTDPAVTETDDVTVTEGELLERETVTPPDGAGDNVTGNGAGWFGPIVTLAGRLITPLIPVPTTETLAVVCDTFGALATIDADPGATPVTGTLTLAAPATNVTLPGTVATLGLLELRLTVKAVGAGAERVSVRICAAIPLMVRFGGEKLSAPLTWTAWLAGV